MLHFSLFDEAKKLRDILIESPSNAPILCNDDDLKSFPFRPTDLGFFIVLVPGKKTQQTGNFTFVANGNQQALAHAFLSKHQVQQLDERLLLVSTACSWDVVPTKMSAVTALGFAAVAFTTPERMQVLGENSYYLIGKTAN